ncbi:MAG: DUF4147 domain-containing protein [Kofleriaceae bacterium]
MSIDSARLLAAYRAAVAACDPAARVRAYLADESVTRLEIAGGRRFGVAIGKAALAMVRGAGPVERGIVIVPATDLRSVGRDSALPSGWRVIESAHPFVDERSVRAARAARTVIDAARAEDVVLALISGGTSSLIEEPNEVLAAYDDLAIGGVTDGGVTDGDATDGSDGRALARFGAITRAVMESGARIEDLNTVRSVLSRVKRGGLVESCAAPVVTLAVSDVIGDGLAVIGSGPTIGAWFVDDETERRARAIAILERISSASPAIGTAVDRLRSTAGGELAQRGTPGRGSAVRDRDHAIVITRMAAFGEAVVNALGPQAWLEHVVRPLSDDVSTCAAQIVARVGFRADAGVGDTMYGTYVFWGEPTLRVPDDHGEGGRAQQLALLLAKAIRGTQFVAMVIGSDGVDGPPPAERAAPAGAIVDGTTWDAIIAAGEDPERSLARCDAGRALHAVGALVVTGPTGINHGDVVVIGDRRE